MNFENRGQETETCMLVYRIVISDISNLYA